MKTCPTCGTTAEERAPFCPCCGTSFVVNQPTSPTPAPAPVAEETKPTVYTPPQPTFQPKKKRNEHALPLTIIAILTAVTVTLASLWLSGSLAAMLGRDTKTADKTEATKEQVDVTTDPLPAIAATYGDGQEITTEEYLAYLYLNFESIYSEAMYLNGQSNYASIWEQRFPYGDSGENLLLSDYIIRATQDSIKLQIVLQQMMNNYGIQWIAADEAEVDTILSGLEEDAFIDVGFDNDTYARVLKNLQLNERATFFGLYGKGGMRAVNELEIRQYFVQNYLSYKMFSVPLTDQNGNPLDKTGLAYRQLMAKMNDYLTMSQSTGFDTAYVTHTGQPASNARVDADATAMDEELVAAVRSVSVGSTAIVEYVSDGIPCVALIQRLDCYDPIELFEQSTEDILVTLKYEAFCNEVEQAMKRLTIIFDATVIDRCKPETFLTIIGE